jgi:hypothetical protein
MKFNERKSNNLTAKKKKKSKQKKYSHCKIGSRFFFWFFLVFIWKKGLKEKQKFFLYIKSLFWDLGVLQVETFSISFLMNKKKRK